MNKKTLLIIGSSLIAIGILKPNLNNFNPISVGNSRISISAPTDPILKKEAEDVVATISGSVLSTKETTDLRDLYVGLANLIKLDGEDKLVSSTENVRQANSLGGRLLYLDLKGKCPDLVKENNDVIVAAIGDDNVALTDSLRSKSADAFMALAWAYNQALK